METISIRVYGRVQGVGFRYFTKLLADKMTIRGTVENKIDGSVKIIAQAEPDLLEAFLLEVKKSPAPYGKVTKTEVEKIQENKEYTNFKVTN